MDIRIGPEGGSRILYRRSGRDMVFEFGIESQDRYTPALVSTCIGPNALVFFTK